MIAKSSLAYLMLCLKGEYGARYVTSTIFSETLCRHLVVLLLVHRRPRHSGHKEHAIGSKGQNLWVGMMDKERMTLVGRLRLWWRAARAQAIRHTRPVVSQLHPHLS